VRGFGLLSSVINFVFVGYLRADMSITESKLLSVTTEDLDDFLSSKHVTVSKLKEFCKANIPNTRNLSPVTVSSSAKKKVWIELVKRWRLFHDPTTPKYHYL